MIYISVITASAVLINMIIFIYNLKKSLKNIILKKNELDTNDFISSNEDIFRGIKLTFYIFINFILSFFLQKNYLPAIALAISSFLLEIIIINNLLKIIKIKKNDKL